MDLLLHFFLLFRRHLRDVQLVSKGSGHCHAPSGMKGRNTSCLVIRNRTDMRSHSRYRIPQRGSVLNRRTVQRVRVVTGPDLRRVVQHAGVKPSASAAAALDQDLRKPLMKLLQHIVQSQNITVGKFALVLRIQAQTVFVADAAVHIPLHIADRCAPQDRADPFQNIIADLPSGKIQNQLVSGKAGLPPRSRNRPVRMRPVKITVNRNGLRLEPDPEQHSVLGDLLCHAPQCAPQLLLIGIPVPQRTVVAAATAEPAVIHDDQLNSHVMGFLRNGNQLLSGKIKIGCLPVVDQNRAPFVLPRSAAHIFPNGFVKIPAQLSQTALAVRHHHLRQVQLLSRLQIPGELVRMNAAQKSRLIELILFHLHEEITAVEEGEAITLPLGLCRFLLTQNGKRMVLVAAGPAHASDGGDTMRYPAPFHVPLHRMPPVQRNPVEVSEGKIQAYRHRLLDPQRTGSLVDNSHGPHNDVLLLQHTVPQLCLQAAAFVLHPDAQTLRRDFFLVNSRKTFNLIQAVHHAIALAVQRCRQISARFSHTKPRRTEVPRTKAAVLLREHIQRIGSVRCSHLIRIPAEAPVRKRKLSVQITVTDAAAVICMDQISLIVDFHLVCGMTGMQVNAARRFINHNCHGFPSRLSESLQSSHNHCNYCHDQADGNHKRHQAASVSSSPWRRRGRSPGTSSHRSARASHSGAVRSSHSRPMRASHSGTPRPRSMSASMHHCCSSFPMQPSSG